MPSSSLREPGSKEDQASRPADVQGPGEDLIDGFIRRQEWMEPVAYFVQTAVGRFYSTLGPVGKFAKDVAHGTKLLGHPLHPALTDAPLGAWLVGAILDWVARSGHAVGPDAGNIALVLGTVAAAAAVVTGYTDFYETEGLERRTALTHGLAMTLVLLLEIVSLVLRWSGAQMPGVLVSTFALLLAMGGMYVGGHLTFRFGTMVNRNAFAQGGEMFVKVGPVTDFPENTIKRVDVDGMPALVVRLDGKLRAIGAACSHAGGPLDEGDLSGSVVTCPLHGARFDLCSGRALSGPATFSQPVFEVRERRDNVELKLALPLR